MGDKNMVKLSSFPLCLNEHVKQKEKYSCLTFVCFLQPCVQKMSQPRHKKSGVVFSHQKSIRIRKVSVCRDMKRQSSRVRGEFVAHHRPMRSTVVVVGPWECLKSTKSRKKRHIAIYCSCYSMPCYSIK